MNTIMFDNFDSQIHTIPQALYMTQSVFGARPAQIYKEDGKWRTITYNDLVYKVENLALGLIKLGIQPGDLLGIKAHTSPRWTWADLGMNYAGAASVSLYPSLSKAETLFIAKDSEIKLLFVHDKKLLIETLGYLSEMPSVEFVICMEKGYRGNGSNIFGIGELMYMGAMDRKNLMPQLQSRLDSLTGDHPTTMVYTSGTTGNLKGVMLSQQSVLTTCSNGYRFLAMHNHGQNYNMVAMCALPLSHILEKVNSYYGPLINGGLIGFSTPSSLMEDIQVIKPTWIMLVPRILARLFLGFEKAFCATEMGKNAWEWAMDVAVKTTYELEDEYGRIDLTIPFSEQLQGQLREDWINAYDAVYWRIYHALGGRIWDLNAGGAYLDPELHRKFVGMGFMVGNGYGLTETGSGCFHTPCDACKIGCCGIADPDIEFKLDEDGEIMVKGSRLPSGYFNNAAATSDCFTADGWFRTGDIGEVDEVGNLRIVDRKKTLIILDTGKNVSSARIEALCGNSGLINQVAILGQDQKYIAALIVPNLDVIVNLLQSEGIPFDNSKVVYGEINGIKTCLEVGEDIIKNDMLIRAIEEEIAKINAQLEDYETIKQFRLVKRQFTEEAGEITPSSKLKMKVIQNKYKELIDDIYK